MRWKSLLLAAVLVGLTCPVPAQQDRQARLKEHERRIREIIERRRAEQQAQEGQPVEPVAVTETPEEPAAEEPTGAVSSVVMGFKFTNTEGESAYNIIVREKDTFLTEVFLFNIDGNPIERVRLALDYDKRFISPRRVFDTTLRPFMEGEPFFEHDDREGMIRYDATLTEPLRNSEVVVLRILWDSHRSTPFTGINFHFDPLEREDTAHTAIFAEGMNILGTKDDALDGVLSGGLMIDIPAGESPVLQGKAEELRELYLGSVASRATVGLELDGPTVPPKVGDAFRVRVRLNNPDGALIDALNAFVKFDPNVLQVIDVDKFNYVHRGVNVHDGPYHRTFPWDMHKRNEVRNDRGWVNYQVSISNGSSLPSKTFADIYFRAIAPTSKTEIYFVKGKLSDIANSSIRYFGYERLDLEDTISIPTLLLPILPAPEEVADASAPSEAAPVVEAGREDPQPASSVRPLRIER